MDSPNAQNEVLTSDFLRPDCKPSPGAASLPNCEIPLVPHSTSLLALCVAVAIFNFLAIPLARGLGNDQPWVVFWAGLLFGILPGEVGALALWLVWGEGSFLRRLAVHWAVGSALCLCFVVGLVAALSDINTPADMWRDVGGAFCLLPLASLAAQAPLWPLRTHLGWRVQCGSSADPPSSKSLSIGDILLGTSVTAITLTLVRLMPGDTSQVWFGAALTAGTVFIVSIVTASPALLLTLRMKELAAGLMLAALYTLVVGFILLAIFGGMGPPGNLPGEFVLAAFIAIYAFAATVISPLIVLWSHGYRLTWPRDRKTREPAA